MADELTQLERYLEAHVRHIDPADVIGSGAGVQAGVTDLWSRRRVVRILAAATVLVLIGLGWWLIRLTDDGAAEIGPADHSEEGDFGLAALLPTATNEENTVTLDRHVGDNGELVVATMSLDWFAELVAMFESTMPQEMRRDLEGRVNWLIQDVPVYYDEEEEELEARWEEHDPPHVAVLSVTFVGSPSDFTLTVRDPSNMEVLGEVSGSLPRFEEADIIASLLPHSDRRPIPYVGVFWRSDGLFREIIVPWANDAMTNGSQDYVGIAGDSFVAVVPNFGGVDATIWRSENGEDWASSVPAPWNGLGYDMQGVSAGPDATFIADVIAHDASTSPATRSYSTADGITWVEQ